MEIISGFGGEKTKPIKAKLPGFGRKLEARNWKSWIPAFAGMTAKAKVGTGARLGARLKKQS